MGYSVASGKLIHEKKPEVKKSRGTVPLPLHSVYYLLGTDDPLVREAVLHRELCIQGKCVAYFQVLRRKEKGNGDEQRR